MKEIIKVTFKDSIQIGTIVQVGELFVTTVSHVDQYTGKSLFDAKTALFKIIGILVCQNIIEVDEFTGKVWG